MREGELTSGRLSDRPLAALLIEARSRAATGVLSIEVGGATSRLFLRHGVPSGAQVAQGFRPLGQVLVQHGLIDVEALDRALPELEKGRPLAEVLLDMGALDAQGLAEAKRLQQEEHLRALSRLDDGRFEFKDAEPPSWTESIKLDAERLIVDALGSPAADSYVVARLVELGPRLLRLGEGHERVAALLGLSRDEFGALEALRDAGMPGDLVARGIDPRRARWMAAALLALGAAHPVDPVEQARQRAEDEARALRQEAERLIAERSSDQSAARRVEEEARRQDELRLRLQEEERQRQELEARREVEERARQEAEHRLQAVLKEVEEARLRAADEGRRIVEEARARAEEEAKKLVEQASNDASERARQLIEEAQRRTEELARAVEQEQAARRQAEGARTRAEQARQEQESHLREAEASLQSIGSGDAQQAAQKMAEEVLARAAAESRQLAERIHGETEEKLRVERLKAEELERQAQQVHGEREALTQACETLQQEQLTLAERCRVLEQEAEEAARHASAEAGRVAREARERAETESRALAERLRAESDEKLRVERAKVEELDRQLHALQAERDELSRNAELLRAQKDELTERASAVVRGAEEAARQARADAERTAEETRRRGEEELRELQSRLSAESEEKLGPERQRIDELAQQLEQTRTERTEAERAQSEAERLKAEAQVRVTQAEETAARAAEEAARFVEETGRQAQAAVEAPLAAARAEIEEKTRATLATLATLLADAERQLAEEQEAKRQAEAARTAAEEEVRQLEARAAEAEGKAQAAAEAREKASQEATRLEQEAQAKIQAEQEQAERERQARAQAEEEKRARLEQERQAQERARREELGRRQAAERAQELARKRAEAAARVEREAREMFEREAERKRAAQAVLDAPPPPSELPAVELTPEPVAELTPEPVAELTPEPLAELTPEPLAELTPEPVAELTPEPVAELTPEPVAELTPEPVAELTPEPVAELTPELVTGAPEGELLTDPLLLETGGAEGALAELNAEVSTLDLGLDAELPLELDPGDDLGHMEKTGPLDHAVPTSSNAAAETPELSPSAAALLEARKAAEARRVARMREAAALGERVQRLPPPQPLPAPQVEAASLASSADIDLSADMMVEPPAPAPATRADDPLEYEVPAEASTAGTEPDSFLERVDALTSSALEMPDQLGMDELTVDFNAGQGASLFEPSPQPLDETGIASAIEALAAVPGAGQPQPPPQPPGPPVLTPASRPKKDSDWMQPPEGDTLAGPGAAKVPAGGAWNAAFSADDEDEFAGLDEGEEDMGSEESRQRRQKLLKRAFGNLGVPTPGRVEGGVVEKPAPAPAPAPAAPAAARPAASMPAPSAPAAAPSMDEAALARVIEERAARLAKDDLFARLDLPRGATKEQAKAAYFKLVKVFHPDRLPPSLSQLLPKMQEIFSAVREAYEVLQDDDRRADYLAQLTAAQAAPAATGAKAEDGAALAKQADLALKRKDFASATDLFGRAFAASKDPSYLAQQAWAIYLDPAQKGNLPQVKAKLEEALRLDRNCDRAAYSLGVIARVEGDLDRAERFFRAAVEANPRNAEASTELRLIQMRRGKTPAPPGPKKGGLFG